MSHGSSSWRNLDVLVFSSLTLVFLSSSTCFSGNLLIGSFISRNGSSWIVNWFVGGIRILLGDMGSWGVDLKKGNKVIK
jgi:hypothetical protein